MQVGWQLVFFPASVFTQVTSPSLSHPWSWRAHCLCGWAHSVNTRSETPSAPTPSWSSAPKASALRRRFWRWDRVYTRRFSRDCRDSCSVISVQTMITTLLWLYIVWWCQFLSLKWLIDLIWLLGSGSESVLCAELCGDSRRASSPLSHTVLLQALQRSRPIAPCCQHCLRLQGQPGHLPAGQFHTHWILFWLGSDLCSNLSHWYCFGFSLPGHCRTRSFHCLRWHEVSAPRQVCWKVKYPPYRCHMIKAVWKEFLCSSGWGWWNEELHRVFHSWSPAQ